MRRVELLDWLNPLKIVRGHLSHTTKHDIVNLFKLPFANLEDKDSIRRFQSELLALTSKEFCVSFSLARTGFYFLLKQLQLPTGTKIALPPIIIKAYLDVVLDLGYSPLFFDLDRQTGGPSKSSLKQVLDDGARVIVIPYLFGVVPDLSAIEDILLNSKVYVIEDVSQSIGCKFQGKLVGSLGHAAIYSSSAVKYLDTYGGGHIMINDVETFHELEVYSKSLPMLTKTTLAKKIFVSLTRNILSSRQVFPIVFLLMRTLNRLGYTKFSRLVGNRDTSPIDELPDKWFCRYSSFQAEIGLKKLHQFYLNIANLISLGAIYDNRIPAEIRFNSVSESFSIRWQYILLLENFSAVRSHFLQWGIDVCQTSLVHIADLPKYGWSSNKSVSKEIYDKAVYLPFYLDLRQKEIERILDAFDSLNFKS